MRGCSREAVSQHVESPGLVQDEETVCRGAYDPIHFNKSGLKGAVVRPKDLISGELSVWRLERDPKFGLAAVVETLTAVGSQDHELREVLAAEVKEIRAIRFSVEPLVDRRVFCVLDDCTTDDVGGWHPEHATIGLCEIDGVVWEAGSDAFDIAKEGLVSFLKTRAVWSNAA